MTGTAGPVGDRVRAEFEVRDERFRCHGDEWLERLHGGCRWTEGPVWVPAGRYLLFDDVPNDRMLRWDALTGAVGAFRAPSGYANGNTLDRNGRLVTCEQGNRWVTRTEHDGSITVLADRVGGARFNSPNDVVERYDGSLWFTDPSYGIDSDYEGYRAESELDGCHVYRLDPATGDVRAVVTDAQRPNGLAFSPDHSLLYVADTRARPSHIRRFEVTADGSLRGGEILAISDAGGFDGVRVDAEGRIWAAAHDGLHCVHPDGTVLGVLRVPEICSNLVFGGPRRNHLFITATTSVYAIRLSVNGAPPPAGR